METENRQTLNFHIFAENVFRIMNKIRFHETSTVNLNDDRTKQIQRFLITHLQLTPRRQLFEEHEKSTMEMRNEDSCVATKTAARVISKSMNESDLHAISELREFRERNARECMSHHNQQRLKRAKEVEGSHLHNYANRYLVPAGVGQLKPKNCDVQGKANEEVHSTTGDCATDSYKFSRMPMKTVRFAPENSLALVYQKFKY